MWYILAIVFGFLVAVGTMLLLGSKKATTLPGGSLSAGMMTGYVSTNGNLWLAALGAVLGLVGWWVYVMIAAQMKRGSY